MDQYLDMLGRLFSSGGWVMWPLSALSLFSVTICVERTIFWVRTNKGHRDRWIRTLSHRLRKGDRSGADELLADDRSVYGRVMTTVLDHGTSEASAIDAVEGNRHTIEAYSSALSTIITAAPMLGILGTVTGIIQSFRLLGATNASVTDPAQVASGISEALITTAFGLIVAMVTLFPYAIFRSMADRCLSNLEHLIAASLAGAQRAAQAPKPTPAPEPKQVELAAGSAT